MWWIHFLTNPSSFKPGSAKSSTIRLTLKKGTKLAAIYLQKPINRGAWRTIGLRVEGRNDKNFLRNGAACCILMLNQAHSMCSHHCFWNYTQLTALCYKSQSALAHLWKKSQQLKTTFYPLVHIQSVSGFYIKNRNEHASNSSNSVPSFLCFYDHFL